MADISVKNIAPTAAEMKNFIQEAAQKDKVNFENAALERCTGTTSTPDKMAQQAYDRMHHTHNRS